MKFANKLYQKLRLFIWRLNCYTSIKQLNIVTWFEINETGDLTLLYRPFSVGFVSTGKIWDMIYDEFIQIIGLNQEYHEYLDDLVNISVLKCEYMLDPSPINKASITIAEEEFKAKKNENGLKYNDLIAQVSKANGGIPLWKTTVVEFYSIKNCLDGSKK